MDANTPAWLRDNATEATSAAPTAPSPNTNGIVESVPLPPTAAAAANTDDSNADDPDLPGIILAMRLANMGVATAMVVTSVRA